VISGEVKKMGGFKRDVRGVSPVVATIMLIAAAAVAGGVILGYVGGLFVRTAPLVEGRATGAVYDTIVGAGENYIDGRLALSAEITYGRLRDVTDRAEGFTILLRNGRTGWSVSLDQGVITSEPTAGSPGTVVFEGTSPAVGGQAADVTVRIPVDSIHRVTAGSTITIDVEITGENAAVEFWRDGDTIEIVITGRDALSLTGFDGAYLGRRRVD
jgi:hypothetical protein